MPHPLDQALREIEAALAAQDERFDAFVDAFRQLPVNTRLDVSPDVFEAIETAPNGSHGTQSFEPQSFEPQSFEPQSFEPQSFEPQSFTPLGALRG